uniref:Uncharacterized protein n=1 Tax=Arundo donax TaxID=35708 RepID=A0A0A9AQV6_ARUDO
MHEQVREVLARLRDTRPAPLTQA